MQASERRSVILRGLMVGSALATGAITGPAFAQEAPAPAAQSAAPLQDSPNVGERTAGEGDIIVTARKRAERLIDVPVAVTALTSQQLARYATSDISQVGRQIPQVMFTRNPSGNGANINIRGVGTNTSADDGVEQAVSVNIDNVPTARGRILQTGLFDLDNVQVLKGPQALYFGKNSPGGSIVIESKGPTPDFDGYIRGGYEFRANEYSLEGAVGGPISDTFGYRVAFRGSDMRHGYVRNVATPILAANNPVAFDRANGLDIPGAAFNWGPQSKQVAGRLTLAYRPTSDFDATFKFFTSYYKDQGDASQNVIASCVPGATRAATTDLSAVFTIGRPNVAVDPISYCGGDKRINDIGELPGPVLAGLPYQDGQKDSNFNRNHNYISSLVLNYRLEEVTLTSVTGFYKYSNRSHAFFDDNALSLAGGSQNSFYHSWTEEVRLTTSFDSPINVTIGGFYGRDRRRYDVSSLIIRDIQSTANSTQRTRGRTLSAFGELSWKITPELELTGGARYTNERKSGSIVQTFVSPKALTLRVARPIAAGPLVGRLSNDNVSPQATLSWRPDSNNTLYVGYRTGFKAGAITNPGLVSNALNNSNIILRPERVRGVEGGYKFQTDDRRLSGDFAAYRYTFKNLQVSAFDSVSNTVLTTNAGGSRLYGAELTLNYQPVTEFSVRGSVGYNHARYTAFANAACFGGQTAAQGCVANQQNLSGERLPRAPDWAASAGASYETPITGGLRLALSVDGRYSSAYKFVATNNPFAVQRRYATVDAAARLLGGGDRWELALIGRNLTDKFYFTVGSERPLGQSPGSVQGVPGLPQTVLLQGTFNF